jgi:hypothetical protein
MGSLPSKRTGTPERMRGTPPSSGETGLSERFLLLLIPLVFITVAITYLQLEVTLMSLMSASRWMLLFGSGSFLTLYFFRQKLHLDLTDGIILSVFGLAPLLMASMLTVNHFFHEPYTAIHRIVKVELEGEWAVIFLENDAYNDFYRIRRFPVDRYPMGDSVTYHFGSGLLGYTVMTGCEW